MEKIDFKKLLALKAEVRTTSADWNAAQNNTRSLVNEKSRKGSNAPKSLNTSIAISEKEQQDAYDAFVRAHQQFDFASKKVHELISNLKNGSFYQMYLYNLVFLR